MPFTSTSRMNNSDNYGREGEGRGARGARHALQQSKIQYESKIKVNISVVIYLIFIELSVVG